MIHRPEQLKFDSLGMSRGVFAPTINFHDGTFYVLNTCVDCGGNYLVTATNPAGPWSNPTWIPEVGGIDPSIFFDDDGKTYVINNDEPTGGSTYQGHRAIWIREFDVAAKKVKGPATMIINAGVDITQKPIWIEGPHIYKINGKYYLSCAEGGTAVDHRQVVFRSDNVLGPYVPAPAPINPILTQRLLDPSRPFPVTSSGHADFLQTQNGEWWGIFLATRPYEDDYYNTGRETFLLPARVEGRLADLRRRSRADPLRGEEAESPRAAGARDPDARQLHRARGVRRRHARALLDDAPHAARSMVDARRRRAHDARAPGRHRGQGTAVVRRATAAAPEGDVHHRDALHAGARPATARGSSRSRARTSSMR